MTPDLYVSRQYRERIYPDVVPNLYVVAKELNCWVDSYVLAYLCNVTSNPFVDIHKQDFLWWAGGFLPRPR
jgi:hypothetical protein